MPVAAFALCLVMFFFSLGPGPFTFVIVNEMLPFDIRGKVVAISVFFNRIGSGTIALTFLSLKNAVGVFAAFTFYAGIAVATTIFYWACVPDLSGKTLEAGAQELAEPNLIDASEADATLSMQPMDAPSAQAYTSTSRNSDNPY